MRRLWINPLLYGIGALIAGAGCAANSFVSCMGYGDNGEAMLKAEFPLNPESKTNKEPVKVLVLTTCAPSVTGAMAGVDGAVASEFIRILQDRCAENKDNVLVKKVSAVDEFKKNHPEWRNQSPDAVGKQLEADYVIDIEIQEISLYQPGTGKEVMQGHSRINVAVYKCSKGSNDKEPVFSPPAYDIDYPHGQDSKFDNSSTNFKQKFIKRIADELVIPYSDCKSEQKALLD